MNLSYNNFIKMEKYIETFKDKRGSLIIILHKAQEIFGYIPKEVQEFIAECVDVPVEKVENLVNFYSFFSKEPRAKYDISVCLGVKCKKKLGLELIETIKDELKIDIGEVTSDGLFTLKAINCLGACGSAPVVVVGNRMISDANIVKIKDSIDELRDFEKR